MKDKLLDNEQKDSITINNFTINKANNENLSISNLTNTNSAEEASDGTSTDNLLKHSKKQNCIQRTINLLKPGSLHGSMFSLALITLGSASLAFPQKYEQMTLIAGVIGTILGGIITYWTLNLLIIAGLKHNLFDYSRLLKKLYGAGFGIVLDVTILVYTFGVVILYSVICKLFFVNI